MTRTRLADGPAPMQTVGADPPVTRAERFERDFLPHLAGVYRAALCLTGDPAAAEDLVVEAFARAYRAVPWCRPGARRQVWLYRILVSIRREHRPGGRPAAPGRAGDQPPVRRAVRELPEYLRLAIHLADVDGFSYQEIAEITGTSAGTVATRVRSARRTLRRRLSTSTEPWP
ncbi:MAG TPA: sigma factor-like helix-turn-helix DNA-binding protein [Streptosporangiaceae bacterium]|nr:sigma factor-like helix-turn-helix DNA-binding protein [Streptosporangiaceae bacterium]